MFRAWRRRWLAWVILPGAALILAREGATPARVQEAAWPEDPLLWTGAQWRQMSGAQREAYVRGFREGDPSLRLSEGLFVSRLSDFYYWENRRDVPLWKAVPGIQHTLLGAPESSGGGGAAVGGRPRSITGDEYLALAPEIRRVLVAGLLAGRRAAGLAVTPGSPLSRVSSALDRLARAFEGSSGRRLPLTRALDGERAGSSVQP